MIRRRAKRIRDWAHHFWLVRHANLDACRRWLQENARGGYRVLPPLASGYRTAWVLLDRDQDAVMFKMVWQDQIDHHVEVSAKSRRENEPATRCLSS